MAASVKWCSSLVWMFVFLVLFSLPCETEERVVATERDRQGREVSGRSLSRTARITDGSVAEEGSNPWMAALFDEVELTSGPFCGGSLIHRRYVLTAAHCVFNRDATEIIVRLGVSDWMDTRRRDYSVEEIIVHEGYSDSTLENNIALLRLTKKVKLGKRINLIFLPKNANFEGQPAKFSGWDRANFKGHSKLRELDVQIMPNADCEEFDGDNDSDSLTDPDTLTEVKEPNLTVFDTSICGTIQELFNMTYSGSPLSFQDNDLTTLVGVFSWRFSDFGLGIFVRVADYLEWLEENM